MFERNSNNPISIWWWTTDRVLFVAVMVLLVAGLIMSVATSPVTVDNSADIYHFARRQALALLPTIAIIVSISLIPIRRLPRLALFIFIIGLSLSFIAAFFGPEIKGAQRWLSIGGTTLQPSELLKPGFVVLSAWFLSQHVKNPKMPAIYFAFGVLVLSITSLLLQPDVGQSALIILTFIVLLFIMGVSKIIYVVGTSSLVVVMISIFTFFGHVRDRITGFLSPTDQYSQIERSLSAFKNGGWFGKGPGEGTIKQYLPDAYSDFIFAVLGEEFGIIACLVLVMVFFLIVFKVFVKALQSEDLFERLALSGLISIFSFQALVNMAVALRLAPTTGMTLPFVSYGLSSQLGMACTLGMVMLLTRHRPRIMRVSN